MVHWLRVKLFFRAFALSVTCFAASACGDDAGPGPGEYESDDPRAADSYRANGEDTADDGAGGEPATDDDDAGRVIEEADIVRIEQDRLYALSRYGGLSVIDVSTQDELTLLGNFKVVATPFEMYVRDGIVFVLYNDYAEYSYDDGSDAWSYYQTSYALALDASDPESIEELGRFPLAGQISDSRIVGDILYVAAYENGGCWECTASPRTHLVSIDVSSPDELEQVDELSFDEREQYSWHRSLMATDQRLYVAGPEWGPSEPVGSTIQVIDISDESGEMQLGAEVTVGGQVESRWQMDEYDGVLRVVSQPFAWRVDRPPVIETFEVESSNELNPLGSASLTLPRPERLQSVRFDGPRAYAITFEQVDPLFTLDLSDPAVPRQVGELEMPGWVYHMEPRGDRVLGLGFDQSNPEGSLTVSLFDVSDLSVPTMLSRVNFGGDWGSLAEDRDRIHKAFNVLDGEELILVPFSGWSYVEDGDACYEGEYLSGVQLVDWIDDELTLRGVAASAGQTRRGFLHDDRLFTMSDERVESFDITDRDAPAKTAAVSLARYVTHTARAGGENVIRVSQNWWTNTTELDVAALASVAAPGAIGTLELPELTDRDSCYQSSWLGEVYSNDELAYLVYDSYSYDPLERKDQRTLRVLTVDVSDASDPVLVGDADLGLSPTSSYYGYADGVLTASGSDIVNLGSTLVISQRTLDWSGGGDTPSPAAGELTVVDLSDPDQPEVETLSTPAAIGFTGLVTSGSVVATSHYEPSELSNDRVQFFLDRFDVSDPADPETLPVVNIPGSLVAFDADSSRAITSDYREVVVTDVTRQICYERYGSGRFEAGASEDDYDQTLGSCYAYRQTLRLIEIDGNVADIVGSSTLDPGDFVGASALGDDRLFLSIGTPSLYYGYYAEAGVGTDVGAVSADDTVSSVGGVSSFDDRTLRLLVLSGLEEGPLSSASLSVSAGDSWGYVPLVASGTRAALSTGFRGKLVVVDASDASEPRVAREVDLSGYVQGLTVVGDTAIAALGYDGAQAISLEE